MRLLRKVIFSVLSIQWRKTAVHYAAESESEGVDKLRFLVESGADVHVADGVSTIVGVVDSV